MDVDDGMSSKNEWSLLFYRIRVLEPFPTEFILYKNSSTLSDYGQAFDL